MTSLSIVCKLARAALCCQWFMFDCTEYVALLLGLLRQKPLCPSNIGGGAVIQVDIRVWFFLPEGQCLYTCFAAPSPNLSAKSITSVNLSASAR